MKPQIGLVEGTTSSNAVQVPTQAYSPWELGRFSGERKSKDKNVEDAIDLANLLWQRRRKYLTYLRWGRPNLRASIIFWVDVKS